MELLIFLFPICFFLSFAKEINIEYQAVIFNQQIIKKNYYFT